MINFVWLNELFNYYSASWVVEDKLDVCMCDLVMVNLAEDTSRMDRLSPVDDCDKEPEVCSGKLSFGFLFESWLVLKEW